MKKILVVLGCLLLMAGVLAGCAKKEAPSPNQSPQTEKTKIVVGATAKPHAEILEVVKPLLAKENIDLEIKVFTDYAQLNRP
jgi:D-methionine transport system substrate-binding protein